ncbi:O-antigen polymerase [Sphingobacterium spiritivorum ATCC 33861]|uniref:O-antigen polymerase n=2 Tax=Sphingobacterium spiritivorum TaxID=258 RepID=D7VM68_SPHSI|nr:O-antigen polymerase [Sphingobacterium spiritivorum ATCC 33861]
MSIMCNLFFLNIYIVRCNFFCKILCGIFLFFLFICPIINFIDFDDRFIISSEFFFLFTISFEYVALTVLFLVSSMKRGISFTILDILIAVFMFYIMIRYSSQNTFAFDSLIFLNIITSVFAYIIFRSITKFLNSKNLILFAINTLSIVVLIVSIHSGLEYFKVLGSDIFKITSVFGNPGILTNYLSISLPFLLGGLYVIKKYSVYRIPLMFLNTLSVFTCISILLLAGQRAALIAVFFGCFFILLIIDGEKMYSYFKRRIVVFFGLFSIIIFFLFFAVSYYSQIKTQSVDGRIFIYKNTLNMIMDNPVFGVGLGKFKSEYNLYQSEWFESNPDDHFNSLIASNTKSPFNEYLLITSELGIIGLLIFGVLTLVIISYSLKTLRCTGNGKEKIVKIASIGSLISIYICSLFSYPTADSSILLLIIFFLTLLNFNQRNVFHISNFSLGVIIQCCFSLIILYNITEVYICHRKWERAANCAENGYFNERAYINIYHRLQSNSNFLYNYGVELLFNNKVEESVRVLEESRKYYTDSDVMVFLGDGYMILNNLDKSEESYLKAVYMVPKKFIPKYALLQFYWGIDECDKAKYWANKILNTKETVLNAKVYIIKEKAKKILNVNCN